LYDGAALTRFLTTGGWYVFENKQVILKSRETVNKLKSRNAV